MESKSEYDVNEYIKMKKIIHEIKNMNVLTIEQLNTINSMNHENRMKIFIVWNEMIEYCKTFFED